MMARIDRSCISLARKPYMRSAPRLHDTTIPSSRMTMMASRDRAITRFKIWRFSGSASAAASMRLVMEILAQAGIFRHSRQLLRPKPAALKLIFDSNVRITVSR
jgi:hypothetical protein